MRVQLAPWGNSQGLRLPRLLLEQLNVGREAEFEVRVRGGELLLRPIPPVTSFDIDDLLDRLDVESVPAHEKWPPVGREIIDDEFSR